MPKPVRTKSHYYRVHEDDCAKQLGVDVDTLVQWHGIGYGPQPYRVAKARGRATRRIMWYNQRRIDEFKEEWQAQRERQELGRFLEC